MRSVEVRILNQEKQSLRYKPSSDTFQNTYLYIKRYLLLLDCMMRIYYLRKSNKRRIVFKEECPRTPYVGAGFSTIVQIRSPSPPRMVKTRCKHDIIQH